MAESEPPGSFYEDEFEDFPEAAHYSWTESYANAFEVSAGPNQLMAIARAIESAPDDELAGKALGELLRRSAEVHPDAGRPALESAMRALAGRGWVDRDVAMQL